MLAERKDLIATKLAEGGALLPGENAIAVGRYKEIDDLLKTTYEDLLPPKE